MNLNITFDLGLNLVSLGGKIVALFADVKAAIGGIYEPPAA